MPLISIIPDFHPQNDARLLERAEQLRPVLYRQIVQPEGGFILKERYSPDREEIRLQQLRELPFTKGQNLCLDFGTHIVGRVSLDFAFKGSHPDAPAFLKFKFAETLDELSENSAEYHGWISSGWIQEEYVHLDEIPAHLHLERRYAFRYLKITVLDTSPKYQLLVRHAECRTETSADWRRLEKRSYTDAELDRISETGLRTLANCMQEVYEDGPKRDRRLWTGDMRLQALVNASSFRNMDLTKRCLYLFAGSRFPDGRVAACVFTGKHTEADDTWLFDYALFFVDALEEYLSETGDNEALRDLYPIAKEQLEYSLSLCGDDGLLRRESAADAFIDWTEGLDKAAAAQCVLIDSLDFGVRLAERCGDTASASRWRSEQARLRKAAVRCFYHAGENRVISNGQFSVASQVWAVLAGLVEGEQAVELMRSLADYDGPYGMMTPYAHHYYLMALLKCGLKAEALAHIRYYWGSMIRAGADTFFEAWDPKDPKASPYGGAIVNSCCHAWSCTPAYILYKYY